MDIVLFYTVCLVLSSKPELNRQRQIKIMNLQFKDFTKKQDLCFKNQVHIYVEQLSYCLEQLSMFTCWWRQLVQQSCQTCSLARLFERRTQVPAIRSREICSSNLFMIPLLLNLVKCRVPNSKTIKSSGLARRDMKDISDVCFKQKLKGRILDAFCC